MKPNEDEAVRGGVILCFAGDPPRLASPLPFDPETACRVTRPFWAAAQPGKAPQVSVAILVDGEYVSDSRVPGWPSSPPVRGRGLELIGGEDVCHADQR